MLVGRSLNLQTRCIQHSMTMVALRKYVAIAAALPAAVAAPTSDRYKYMIQFVACEDLHCQKRSWTEQHAPWKYVEDGQCKSYYSLAFGATTMLGTR